MFGRIHHQHDPGYGLGGPRSGLARLLVLGVLVALVARAVSARRGASPRPAWRA